MTSTSSGATPLKAAVIGAGRISAEHLTFLNKSPLAELAAVCDLSPSLGEFARSRYGVERAYTSHKAMLEEVEPQVVHLCTPPHTHVSIATDCLKAGAHVICEKPIAPTNEEFQELWRLAEEQGVVLIEDHCNRFTREFLTLEKLIAEGKIGEIREAEIRVVLNIANPKGRYGDANLPHPSHGLPAGVIHELLPHMTYMILRFLPGFEYVRAAWNRHGTNDLLKYDDLDAVIISDGVHGRLRFTSHEGPDCFLVTVRGTEGWVETEFYRPYVQLTTARPGGEKLGPLVNRVCQGFVFLRAGVTGLWDKIMQRSVLEGIHTLLGETYEALATDAPPPVSYDDMDQSTKLIDALLREENRM